MPSSEQQTIEIVRLYRSGMSLRAVGKKVGLSHEAVAQRLARVGVSRKGHPRYSKLPPGKTYEDIAKESKVDSTEGLAAYYGVSTRTISRWVAKADC